MYGEGGGYEEEDEFRRVVSKTFGSEDEGYQFYNEYAKVKGFSVRKEDVKYLSGTSTRFRRLYTCWKEGHRTLANFERTEPKRTPKALTRCGCTSHLEIEMNRATGEWFVKKFKPDHNHPLAKEGESAYLYSHRKMTDGQNADVVGYGIGGLHTHKIMDVMEHQAGGPDKVGFIS
jgi:zinc finger SWIM domain-containing protein 3